LYLHTYFPYLSSQRGSPWFACPALSGSIREVRWTARLRPPLRLRSIPTYPTAVRVTTTTTYHLISFRTIAYTRTHTHTKHTDTHTYTQTPAHTPPPPIYTPIAHLRAVTHTLSLSCLSPDGPPPRSDEHPHTHTHQFPDRTPVRLHISHPNVHRYWKQKRLISPSSSSRTRTRTHASPLSDTPPQAYICTRRRPWEALRTLESSRMRWGPC
jgi:hypothetical protein